MRVSKNMSVRGPFSFWAFLLLDVIYQTREACFIRITNTENKEEQIRENEEIKSQTSMLIKTGYPIIRHDNGVLFVGLFSPVAEGWKILVLVSGD